MLTMVSVTVPASVEVTKLATKNPATIMMKSARAPAYLTDLSIVNRKRDVDHEKMLKESDNLR